MHLTAIFLPCPDRPLKESRKASRKKILLAMKLTAIFFLAGCLQLSAAGFSQGITLSEKNVPLKKIFGAIEKQTNYVFFYDADLLRGTKPVTVQATNETLENVLRQCLQGQSGDGGR